MASIIRDDVIKLAALAKLKIDNKQVDKFMDELKAILDYVEQLDRIDTSGVEPTAQVTGLKDVFRDDVIKNYQAEPQALLESLHSVQDKHIKVKRVIE